MIFLETIKIGHRKLTNLLVLSGLLFSITRLIRETDLLYTFAILSFLSIWGLNYKFIYNLKFKQTFIWFSPFAFWVIVSFVWSLEPFISLSRGLFYIFISGTAVLVGFLYKNNSKELFNIFLILNALIVFVSIVSLISGIPADAWTANHGMGFTSIFKHQNSFAAVLMFTLIGPIYFLINCLLADFFGGAFRTEQSEGEKSKKRKSEQSVIPVRLKPESNNPNGHSELVSESTSSSLLKFGLIFSFILIILNVYFIYLSYSRATMLALFIGAVVLILLLGNKKSNLIFILSFFVFTISILFLFGNKIEKYFQKGNPNYLARRNILWIPSYNSALDGGLIGLGYGVTDPKVNSIYKKENIFKEIKREKGNSILALIEEVGVIGLGLFILPIYAIVKNTRDLIIKKTNSYNFGFLVILSFLITFIIHAQFEAWMVGVSSFYLFIFIIFLSLLIEK